jgi:hypothetical protein
MFRKTLHVGYRAKIIQLKRFKEYKTLFFISHKLNHNFSTKTSVLTEIPEKLNKKFEIILENIIHQNETLISQHKKMRIPFIDEEFYRKLLDNLITIPQEYYLETADIIARYVKLNIDHIDNEFFAQIILELSKRRYSDFEFWYLSEKRVIQIINNFTNYQLAMILHSFAINDKGSNRLFNIFAKEVLDRKIRSFTKVEFFYIYDGFKRNNIKDKLLWAIMDRAKIECFSDNDIEKQII